MAAERGHVNRWMATPSSFGNIVRLLGERVRLRVAMFSWLATIFVLVLVFRIHDAAGGPSAPLDDAYIHLQYARSIAEGHPFRYSSPGDAPSSGATSVLYVVVLALPHALGMHGESMLLVAQLLAIFGWVASMEGGYRLGQHGWGNAAGWCAAAIMFCCAGIVWTAGSAMEAIFALAAAIWLFTWSLDVAEESLHAARPLAVLAFAAPFIRPELAALSLVAGVVLLVRLRGANRWLALVAVLGVVAFPAFWWWITGHARSTGAIVKWLPADVYLSKRQVIERTLETAWRIFDEVLAGKAWGKHYFPRFTHWLGTAGLLLVVVRALRRRAVLTALVWAAAIPFLIVPATFATWSWHRLRYLWPMFAVLLACSGLVIVAASQALAQFVARRIGVERSAHRVARFLLFGLVVAAPLAWLWSFAKRIPDAIDDLAHNSQSIRRQQVAMAIEHVAPLDPAARILINDAGAIAYFGGHPTVDIVGLTTTDLALATAQGRGSVFEQLESMPPEQRPTHAAVYRGWMPASILLGEQIAKISVRGHTNLGGTTKWLGHLRTEVFGSGAAPFTKLATNERVVDEVDVADLASERTHAFVNGKPAHADNLVRWHDIDGKTIVDGGRVVFNRERMTLRGQARCPSRVLLRTDAFFDAEVAMKWNGELVRKVKMPKSSKFIELSFPVPAEQVKAENRVEFSVSTKGANYGSFHHFFVQRCPAKPAKPV